MALHISYQITEDEYVRAYRFYLNQRYHMVRKIGFFAMLFALAVFLCLGEGANVYLGYLMLMLLFTPLLLSLKTYFSVPRTIFRDNSSLGQHVNAEFSDGGAAFSTDGGYAEFAWKRYKQVWEDENFFFLIQGKNLFNMVPKHAFTTESMIEFRELLRVRVNAHFEHEFVDAAKAHAEIASAYKPRSLEPPDWR